MLSSKQPSDGINSLNTQGLRPEKDQEIFFEAQRLQWAGCLECLAGVHYEAMRIFGLQIETTVGTGGGGGLAGDGGEMVEEDYVWQTACASLQEVASSKMISM